METSTADTSQSLNVEESRAKRLERQHARLRDRGGIFRPTNRNNNLFDVLVQATHRRSPCRSRSVSPQKKAKTASTKTQVSSSSKPSVLKDKPALGVDMISEPAKDESVMQKQTKNPKRKQNQGSEAEVGNGSTKSKSQSKKTAPKHKKDIAPRQKTKSSTNDECSEHRPSSKKVQKPKSKGQRKKTDVNEVVVDPPPKELSVEAAKCTSAPQTLITAAEKQNSYQSQSHHQVATAFLRDEVHKEKLTIDRPQKKDKVDLLRDPLREPVVPTKPRSRKRKVESEALDVDGLPPKKRRAPSKSRSANIVGVQNLEMENDAPAGSTSMSQALANAINSARPLANKESSGHTRQKTTSEAPPPHPDRRENIDPRPRIASKTKRKRPQAPVEGIIDETHVEMGAKTKKPKTTAPAPVKPQQKDVVPHPIAPNPSEKNRTSPHNTEPAKDSAKYDNGKRAYNPTISKKKKRKENATVGKPIKMTSTSKNKTQSKGRPRIPLHVKKKLDVQYSACPSDDEPDPIDFLS